MTFRQSLSIAQTLPATLTSTPPTLRPPSMAHENRDDPEHADEQPLVREMRVDAAHPVQRPEAAAPAVKLVAAGHSSYGEADTDDEFGVADMFTAGTPAEALARHAAELAEKLKSRLADLDHREASLHGQEAELDSRIRSARLWLEERESELDQREETLEQREVAESPKTRARLDASEHADRCRPCTTIRAARTPTLPISKPKPN